MRKALQNHWPEYLMEAAELAVFMISASLFTILLYHPATPAVRAIPAEFIHRTLMGLAMGLTALALVYSPWGKQSGARMNPAEIFLFPARSRDALSRRSAVPKTLSAPSSLPPNCSRNRPRGT